MTRHTTSALGGRLARLAKTLSWPSIVSVACLGRASSLGLHPVCHFTVRIAPLQLLFLPIQQKKPLALKASGSSGPKRSGIHDWPPVIVLRPYALCSPLFFLNRSSWRPVIFPRAAFVIGTFFYKNNARYCISETPHPFEPPTTV